ncbi:MAG TPA: aldehyde dehydrogenase family protein [Nevskiaceae bacterium]|nr:aldehyde dehydrogenase family protein [Nevskiaceae bacterium]
MDAEPRFAGYIDGTWVAGSGANVAVEDPSYGSVVATFSGLSTAQFETAIGAARKAHDDGRWSGLSAADRRARLKRFVAAMAKRADPLVDLVMREAGCPRAASVMQSQVRGPIKQAGEIIELSATLPELEENPLPLSERLNAQGQVMQSLRRYTPVGVVAGIAAYNFPVYTALWKVMPALLAGNTVLLRPSPLTPLSALVLAEAAHEAELPAGVLNVVIEAGLDGARLLTTDPAVDMVAFTGSSHVGVQVMTQAAPTMKRLQLELGGKSAQIFLPDAVDRAAMGAMIVCMAHAGQGCALGTRIFVPQERKDEVLKSMAGAMGRIQVGPADQPSSQMGPVISAAQVERCEHYVRAAVDNGGRVVTGGKRPPHLEKGHFFEPTVLDLPDNRNPAAQDEIFGPVVSVIGYRDVDHAVEMANDSRFGLSGYVHGQDRKAALDVALRIRSGTVNVNGALASTYNSAGGQRMSGVGRERGVDGLRLYQQLVCLNIGSQ